MIQRIQFHAMGSRMEAILDDDVRPSILDEVPAWFEEWEQVLSRFRVDSELSLLNRSAGQAVQVSSILWEVFQTALDAESYTAGLINPLVMDALMAAGYDRDFDQMNSPVNDAAMTIVQVPSLDTVRIDERSRTLCLPLGCHLDFGGIAKGWAAHQAVLRLKSAGPALVNAGGDIAVSGSRLMGEPWPIDVENPFDRDTIIETVHIHAGGIATSGRDYRHWLRNGIQQHHIIDPRSGLPARSDILTATVIAPSAMEAEALAKTVLISGSDIGLARLDGDPRLAGLLVLDNGLKLYSRNLDRYL